MPNQYKNKVIYYGTTLMDITPTTATASDVLYGEVFFDKSGAQVTGQCTYDADTSSATAAASEILFGETAFVNGNEITGSMPNIGSQTATITARDQVVVPTLGYHDGGGSIQISSTERNKIVATNIKNGVEILGITGSYTGSELVKATTGSATPATSSQTVLPSSYGDYDYFTQFTVAAVLYTESDNAAGGVTVTIGSSIM